MEDVEMDLSKMDEAEMIGHLKAEAAAAANAVKGYREEFARLSRPGTRISSGLRQHARGAAEAEAWLDAVNFLVGRLQVVGAEDALRQAAERSWRTISSRGTSMSGVDESIANGEHAAAVRMLELLGIGRG